MALQFGRQPHVEKNPSLPSAKSFLRERLDFRRSSIRGKVSFATENRFSFGDRQATRQTKWHHPLEPVFKVHTLLDGQKTWLLRLRQRGFLLTHIFFAAVVFLDGQRADLHRWRLVFGFSV